MQHFGKAALRVTKNYTKGYSDTQAKVRDATSNDPWGPSGTQMNEIAQLTYNQNDFIEIMEMLDKRLNDKGKNWRHVFRGRFRSPLIVPPFDCCQSLTVLDYCLHQGSENVVIYFRDNIYVIKTLKEFQYMDEDGKDQGANVRQKAKDITNLLQDESRLREERRTRASMRDRMIRGVGGDEEPIDVDENTSRRRKDVPYNGLVGKRPNRDEDELRRAIEESKKSLMQDRMTAEERDLQAALKLSKEEEDKRKQDMENSNASALFDDSNQLAPPTQSNNPFPLIDPTPYAVGLQPQYTVQPQFTQVQPQFTAFNPYQQQAQAEQEAQQAEFLRQQQMFMLQQQQAQQQQQQQEEWLRQQQLAQMQQQQQMQQQNLFAQQPLQVQPTGFGNNNPFAPTSPSSLSPSPNPPFQQQRPSPSFNLGGTYEQHSTSALASLSTSPQPQTQLQPPAPSSSAQGRPIHVKTKDQNETLAALFADREGGQDTFGNVGQLRYGYTDAGRSVLAQQTGSSHNPFAIQQQQQQQQHNERPFFDI
ncbi:ENTH-domain-containing protein [Pholiota conissans]|uniref:ENTH-domain-containing protein n=1 Tax=Pholiota conissans TaxID=109636 RepID=A0A9P5YTU6_9AGAR|nr:ENTH-domain-containing protein [Pholiota conissans]